MVPLDLSSGDAGDIVGVNVANVNPAHQLFSFGIEGNGTVQFWDPRARSRVGMLRLPVSSLMPSGTATSEDLSVTAIASRSDGLSYAIGTSTGHTLLYDIRSPRPYATKDQGYGLPVQCLEWVEGGGRVGGEGMVISADKKVVKIWDRNSVRRHLHFFFVILTAWLDEYKFRIRYSVYRYQPRSPCSWIRFNYACERGDTNDSLLYPPTGTCPAMV